MATAPPSASARVFSRTHSRSTRPTGSVVVVVVSVVWVVGGNVVVVVELVTASGVVVVLDDSDELSQAVRKTAGQRAPQPPQYAAKEVEHLVCIPLDGL